MARSWRRPGTDAGGNFVMTPPPLKPGDYALSLREGQGAAAIESKQSVAVSVPAAKTGQVVVALAEPGKATTLLSAPPADAAAASAASHEARQAKAQPAVDAAKTASGAPTLSIRSVELENGSGLFASGSAPPGTDVRVYPQRQPGRRCHRRRRGRLDGRGAQRV